MEKQENNRTRINVSLTAKGLAQWDITAEYASPEESATALRAAIDHAQNIIREKGLKEVGSE
jgi:DNA-binding MarR family transcriptional regulator